MKHTVLLAACLLALAGCTHKTDAGKTSQATETINYTTVVKPAFDADSAMERVKEQLAFGMRTPGSAGWQRCGNHIAGLLSQWCDTVIEQPFSAVLWDGSRVPGRNIIGSINPQASRRVLLAAHWDTRLWADHDNDESKHRQPVPGANDGASGTAVLLEMARAMSAMPPSVGIDFIFFDVEDQGIPEWAEMYEDNTWCKGSQYWAENRHIPFYTAVYGILFDMVGTQRPHFTKEQVSRHFAPGLTDKIWNAAAALGHSAIFDATNTDPILDDHLYVNQIAGIPMVDIVQNSPTTSFFEHWHTTTDDIQSVDPQTMEIVATVVMTTIYADFPTAANTAMQ